MCFLPGMMLDGRMWKRQLSAIQPLADAFVGDLSASASIAGMAADVLYSAPQKFHLVGLSLGAIVAMEIWRQEPGRVASLVVSGLNPQADPTERRGKRLAQVQRANVGELRAMMQDTFLPNYFAEPAGGAALIEAILAAADDLGPAVFERQTEAQLGRPDSLSTLAEVDVPALVICGSQDRITPPSGQWEVARGLRNARFETIENAGHLVPMEQPAQFNEILLSFLEEQMTDFRTASREADTRIIGKFAERLRSRLPLAGLFVRSSDYKQIEVIGSSHVDVVCLDAEHSTFDRVEIDRCLLAAQKAVLPCLVRVPKLDADVIAQALDAGAAGVLVPHVKSSRDARYLARVSRYGVNGRGYASSCRSSGYGQLGRAEIIRRASEEVCVMAMLEDPEAFDDIDAIVGTQGIDGFFIGKADLSVAMGVGADSGEINARILRACEAAGKHGKALGMVLASTCEAPKWLEKGMSFFLISSDYLLLMEGATRIASEFAAAAQDVRG